jgi:hypothetical protein
VQFLSSSFCHCESIYPWIKKQRERACQLPSADTSCRAPTRGPRLFGENDELLSASAIDLRLWRAIDRSMVMNSWRMVHAFTFTSRLARTFIDERVQRDHAIQYPKSNA